MRLLLLALCLLASCARRQTATPRPQPVFETQVKNAVRAGDGDAEIQALRKRLMDSPNDTQLRRRLAARFDAAGYPDLALEHLRLAFEHAPGDTQAALELAAKLRDLRLDQQALETVARVERQAGIAASDASSAAILLDHLGQLTRGEALHRRALAANPGSPQYRNNLAYNLMRQMRGAEAETLWRALLAEKPSNEVARNNLAELYATQLNRPEEALAHWKAVSGPAIAHNNLAAAWIAQGKFAEAKAELEKALAIRFQFPEAVANLQLVAARTGGTVELNLGRDKKPASLSKLAKAFKMVFLAEDRNRNLNQRSHP
jgi:Flp pilus assembly protein TadD